MHRCVDMQVMHGVHRAPRTCSSLPATRSQMSTWPSLAALATHLPSGLKRTQVRSLSWPV